MRKILEDLYYGNITPKRTTDDSQLRDGEGSSSCRQLRKEAHRTA